MNVLRLEETQDISLSNYHDTRVILSVSPLKNHCALAESECKSNLDISNSCLMLVHTCHFDIGLWIRYFFLLQTNVYQFVQ